MLSNTFMAGAFTDFVGLYTKMTLFAVKISSLCFTTGFCDKESS